MPQEQQRREMEAARVSEYEERQRQLEVERRRELEREARMACEEAQLRALQQQAAA